MSRSPSSRIVLVAAVVSAGVPVAAREPDTARGAARVVTRVVGPEYAASGLKRAVLGSNYRDVWTTPISVPVLDLKGEAGGLRPTKKGGSRETRALHLETPDGREFRFRSVNKDASGLADGIGFVEDIVKDQTRAEFPAAPVAVARLAETAGIPHLAPRLLVMPDDPALGEFRAEFAGMVGTLEETPRAGGERFSDFEEVVDWEALEKRLDADPHHQVDTRAYLESRLFDLWIGDWDRHGGQYDFGRRTGTTTWYPIPKDRDRAFSDYDGLATAIARKRQPRILRFERGYPGMVGFAWNARVLDRRLLAPAEWPMWAELAAELEREMTDAAIAEGVAALPAEYVKAGGERLRTVLRARREALLDGARELYALLAEDAEVYATGRDDVLEIDRASEADHSVVLRLSSVSANGGTTRTTYFERRYRGDETDEVRVFLLGGDDRAVSKGDRHRTVKVRVMGGPGDDVLDDSGGGHTSFYDHEGSNRVVSGSGTVFDERPYVHPLDGQKRPEPDWGGLTFPVVTADAGGDLGLLLGLGMRHTGHGFRKHPYGSRYTLTVGYATGQRGFRVDGLAEFREQNRAKNWEVFGRASEVELVRFSGFGNESVAPERSSFYKADQTLLLFQPRYRFGRDRAGLWIGPVAKWSSIDLDSPGYLGLARPYGIGDFGQVGAGAAFLADSRTKPTGLETGARLRLGGHYYPKAWSLERAFGEAHGDASVYLTAPVPTSPTLALRVGGKQVFGDLFPFHESAFLGGSDTLRGLRRNRYAGERAAFGNAELRFRLGKVKLFVPITVGLFGLADAGRVWVDGETSDEWHTAFGGGAFFSFHKPEYLVSVSAAQDRKAKTTRVYFKGGFAF